MNQLTQKYLKIDNNTLTEKNISEVFDELIVVINYHNKLYYEEWKSEISDGEYDQLFLLLQKVEKQYPQLVSKNSPTQKVWWTSIAEWFIKAPHPIPLISLSNSYNAEDVRDWHKQLHRIAQKEWIQEWSYIVEPKLDGSSVEIVYRKWVFVQAITRWDGRQWEDITNNVKMLRNLPLYVQWLEDIEEIRLRWEILLPQRQFDIINQQLAKVNEPLFANPRNAAAGTLRQLDSQIVYNRGLVIFLYDVLSIQSDLFNIQSDVEQLLRLGEIWLPIYPWHQECKSIEDVVKHCENKKLIKELEDANVEMDGLVIKVNELWYRAIFGKTEHHPRRAMAFKFPTKQVAAHILDITYQVGRTWAITPVAELDPVALWWVTVSRATLHNFDYIADRDIRIWDRVWVQRSGEVIPYIIWPIESRRMGEEKKIKPLEKCPSCESKLIQVEWEVALTCLNTSCEARLIQQLQHFVSKNCLNINWLWDSIIELMVGNGVINNISDLYTLSDKVIELRSLQGMWDKKISTILDELELSKTKELWRWIHWFGIKFVGKKISQDLVKWMKWWLPRWQSIDWSILLKYFWDSEYLDTVFGLGKQTILTLSEWSRDKIHISLIRNLEDAGVEFWSEKNKQSEVSDTLQSEKFVITWSFEWYSRDTLADMIVQHGGDVVASVSKNTDYLLCGTKAWSKLNKAQELWIKIISLKEFGVLIWETIEEKKSAGADQNSLFG